MISKVLKSGTVLAFDDVTQSVQVLRDASVLIQDDRIAAIGPDDKLEVPAEAEVIDVKGKIVSPGFINTHVHMWQTVHRTLGPNIVLPHYFSGWLNQYSKTTVSTFTGDDIYISALEGYLEGLHGGVTSYLDHAHNNWSPTVVEPGYNAAKDSGARVWWCYDVADRENFSEKEQWEALSRIAADTDDKSLVQPGLSVDCLAWSFTSDSDNHLEYTQQMIKYAMPIPLLLYSFRY